MVQVDERFRVTLPRGLRKRFQLSAGEKLYIISSGDILLVRKIPSDPSSRLEELIGGIRFDREARRGAEKWLQKEAQESA